MKIIGVTGKSGAGKTTFSNYLGERKNIGVIHLDDEFNEVKEEKFKNSIKDRNKNDAPIILTSRTRRIINSNKIIFLCSIFAKRLLMKNKIKKKLEAFKREGKDAVVIDSIYLKYLTRKNMYDKIIYIDRPFHKRLEAVEKRDGIDKEEFIERDVPFKKKFIKINLKQCDYVIENDGNEQSLRNESEKIYDEVVGIKTFDEKYRVDLKTLKHQLTKTISRTKKREQIDR